MIDWTDAQWDAYEAETVTLPVTLLDSLVSAAKMHSRGNRIEKHQRQKWAEIAKQAQAHADEIVAKIERNET